MRPWYRLWFGEAYKALYPHRDHAEAARQIDFLISITGCRPEWRVLDIGCGSGRHLAAFARRGIHQAYGIDLSDTLLRDARQASHDVARADMRRLPFRPGHFHLLTSLFTSFGYFEAPSEDMAALAGFAACLKPGGSLFLDLPDQKHVLDHLVARDERKVDDLIMIQERRAAPSADGMQVVKRIEIQAPDGKRQVFEEKVRLYEKAFLENAAKTMGLSLAEAFGDEQGSAYRPGQSPRMALLWRKNPG